MVTGVLVVTAPVFSVAYAYAASLVVGRQAPLRSWVVAVAAGTLVFVPAALLFPWFALAAVLWLALVGLVVPVAIAEGTSLTRSLRRGSRARPRRLRARGGIARERSSCSSS